MDVTEDLQNIVDEIASTEIGENAEQNKIEEPTDKLPENSPTILLDETHSRFSSAIWAEKVKETSVLLAGLGGIGSYVAFLLSRCNIKCLTVIDPDTVDATNLSGQLYSQRYVGEFKTSAISRIIGDFSNFYRYHSVNERYGSEVNKIMICGFDNMQARKQFYYNWKEHASNYLNPENLLFIDGRLASESFQVFCITGDAKYLMKKYEEKWLFDDKDAEQTICSNKQTSYCANMIGSVITNLFINFITNQCSPLIRRELPFLTTYEADTMLFKTERI